MIMDDPTATYRGYRRQALYALFRLFDEGLPEGAVIQPEGHEDLAIFDSAGSLVEIVQVKDHSDNLAVSSFKPSFYERIAPYWAVSAVLSGLHASRVVQPACGSPSNLPGKAALSPGDTRSDRTEWPI